MSATASTYLPTEEELTVQEINLSWPILQASAFHVGKACEWTNNEYLLCKKELKDPRKCLQEGKNVTSCALEFFKKLKKHCLQEVDQYARCLERSSSTLELHHCRQTQAALDKCVLKHLNIERPPYGYFCEARVHDSSRPPPPPEELMRFPDASGKLDKDAPLPPAKYGNRFVIP